MSDFVPSYDQTEKEIIELVKESLPKNTIFIIKSDGKIIYEQKE
jgi:hypothetical protein